MSDQAAKALVLVCGGVMFAAIGLRRDTIPDPLRYAWAAGAITLFLSLLSDISPQVAGPSAILVLIAVWYRHRDVLHAGGGTSSASSGDFTSDKGPDSGGGGDFNPKPAGSGYSSPGPR